MSKTLKETLKRGILTYISCIVIAAIIYMTVVIENYYQGIVKENPFSLSYQGTVLFAILFIGFLIFILVLISPYFRRVLFGMFGIGEEKEEQNIDEPEKQSQNTC